MVEDVLTIAGAELQPSHQPQYVGMQVVEAQLKGCRFSLLADRFLHLGFDFLDDFFNASGMDSAVSNQALDRLARDFTPQWIEAGQDDRSRRVVDDQLDAGRCLERANVASFAADDPAF